MATTFSGYLSLGIVGALVKSLDIGTSRLDVSYSKKLTLTDGTGANQANMLWTDTRTLTSGSTEDLDVYGGLTNAFGDTINLTAIKAVIIVASTENTTNLTVGGDSADASTIRGTLKPGGWLVYADPSAAGDAVADSTADIIQVANAAGASADYDIIVIGEV